LKTSAAEKRKREGNSSFLETHNERGKENRKMRGKDQATSTDLSSVANGKREEKERRCRMIQPFSKGERKKQASGGGVSPA